MKNSIEIKSPISEWTVFQQVNGFAKIHLHGVFTVEDTCNYPVIKVLDENEKTVLYSKVETRENCWSYNLNLPIGLYKIETGIALKEANFNPIYLRRGTIIRNIFVGENFLIAGQSNAVGFGKDEVCDYPQYGVCMFNGKWDIAKHPIGHMNSNQPNADYLNSGHSAWLNFGKLILNNQKTPVGLIPAGLGGSSIADWSKGSPLFNNAVNLAKQTKAKHLIWYQGCSDVFDDKPKQYKERLYSLILELKRQLGDISTYVVQISGTTNAENPDNGWRQIREIQRQVAVKTQAMLIPTYDLINFTDDIHLGSSDNIKLSNRVYNAYLSKSPEKAITYTVGENSISLKFNGINKIDKTTAKNIVALDSDYNKLPCEISASKNIIKVNRQNIDNIGYISLPFGRLFNGSPLYDNNKNLVAYFCVEINLP